MTVAEVLKIWSQLCRRKVILFVLPFRKLIVGCYVTKDRKKKEGERNNTKDI